MEEFSLLAFFLSFFLLFLLLLFCNCATWACSVVFFFLSLLNVWIMCYTATADLWSKALCAQLLTYFFSCIWEKEKKISDDNEGREKEISFSILMAYMMQRDMYTWKKKKTIKKLLNVFFLFFWLLYTYEQKNVTNKHFLRL